MGSLLLLLLLLGRMQLQHGQGMHLTSILVKYLARFRVRCLPKK